MWFNTCKKKLEAIKKSEGINNNYIYEKITDLVNKIEEFQKNAIKNPTKIKAVKAFITEDVVTSLPNSHANIRKTME